MSHSPSSSSAPSAVPWRSALRSRADALRTTLMFLRQAQFCPINKPECMSFAGVLKTLLSAPGIVHLTSVNGYSSSDLFTLRGVQSSVSALESRCREVEVILEELLGSAETEDEVCPRPSRVEALRPRRIGEPIGGPIAIAPPRASAATLSLNLNSAVAPTPALAAPVATAPRASLADPDPAAPHVSAPLQPSATLDEFSSATTASLLRPRPPSPSRSNCNLTHTGELPHDHALTMADGFGRMLSMYAATVIKQTDSLLICLQQHPVKCAPSTDELDAQLRQLSERCVAVCCALREHGWNQQDENDKLALQTMADE